MNTEQRHALKRYQDLVATLGKVPAGAYLKVEGAVKQAMADGLQPLMDRMEAAGEKASADLQGAHRPRIGYVLSTAMMTIAAGFLIENDGYEITRDQFAEIAVAAFDIVTEAVEARSKGAS